MSFEVIAIPVIFLYTEKNTSTITTGDWPNLRELLLAEKRAGHRTLLFEQSPEVVSD